MSSCPFKQRLPGNVDARCAAASCAIWDKDVKQCALLTIAVCLKQSTGELEEAVHKLNCIANEITRK